MNIQKKNSDEMNNNSLTKISHMSCSPLTLHISEFKKYNIYRFN